MPRSFETTLDSVYRHRVTVQWWDIRGPVTNDRLVEDAEECVRHGIGEIDCERGEMHFEDGESSARGWWEISRTCVCGHGGA
jgi:hypothetical protein